MFTISLRLVDLLVHGNRDDDGKWTLYLHDILTGKTDKVRMEDEELGASLALGIGGEHYPDGVIKGLYELAEPVQAEDIDLRIIP